MSAGGLLSDDGTAAALMVRTNDNNAHMQLYNITENQLMAVGDPVVYDSEPWMCMSPSGAYASLGPQAYLRQADGKYQSTHFNTTALPNYMILSCAVNDQGLLAIGLVDHLFQFNVSTGYLQWEAVQFFQLTLGQTYLQPLGTWRGPNSIVKDAKNIEWNSVGAMRFDPSGRFMAAGFWGVSPDIQPTLAIFDTKHLPAAPVPALLNTSGSVFDLDLVSQDSQGTIVVGGLSKNLYIPDSDLIGQVILASFSF
jgi:hypothetical protein